MGFFDSIKSFATKAVDTVKQVAPKVIDFGKKVLDGPVGDFASNIPGVKKYVDKGKELLGAADGWVNGKGDGGKAIAKGLTADETSPLGPSGSWMSNQGLATLAGLFGMTDSTQQVSDLVSGFTCNHENDSSPESQGDQFNLQQIVALNVARLLLQSIGLNAVPQGNPAQASV
jgi:hypothetical protein